MDFKKFLKSNFGITVNKMDFYNEALTHNSYANEHHLDYTYQRLEFLGDAILEKYVSLFLFKTEKFVDEGVLTKSRSNIVREETLATVTEKIGLNKFIRLGNGEEASGGRQKNSILGDIFESITAAIYMDHENENPDQIVDSWLKQTLMEYIAKDEYLESIRDYKSELQELLQAENRNDLKYIVDGERKKDNNRIEYFVSVCLEGQKYGTGSGYSKQVAEQQAAKNCLAKLHISK